MVEREALGELAKLVALGRADEPVQPLPQVGLCGVGGDLCEQGLLGKSFLVVVGKQGAVGSDLLAEGVALGLEAIQAQVQFVQRGRCLYFLLFLAFWPLLLCILIRGHGGRRWSAGLQLRVLGLRRFVQGAGALLCSGHVVLHSRQALALGLGQQRGFKRGLVGEGAGLQGVLPRLCRRSQRCSLLRLRAVRLGALPLQRGQACAELVDGLHAGGEGGGYVGVFNLLSRGQLHGF